VNEEIENYRDREKDVARDKVKKRNREKKKKV
jgi:hypothetical protein